MNDLDYTLWALTILQLFWAWIFYKFTKEIKELKSQKQDLANKTK